VGYEVPRNLLARLQTSAVERLNDTEDLAAVQDLEAILDTKYVALRSDRPIECVG